MKQVYKAWCEYDVGLDDTVYATEELAWESLRAAVVTQGLDWPELQYDGLAGVDALEYREE